MFRSSARIFTLFGFEVKLDITWLLLAFLISWSLATGVFPIEYPGLSVAVYWWMGIACAIGVFFSIVLHELSHSLVARYYKMPIRGITLFIFGGVAEMESEPPGAKAEFLMAVAGPIASLVISIVVFLLHKLGVTWQWHTAITGVCFYLAFINLVVAIFNLVPAFPLDGGRMLRAVLWAWKRDMKTATRIASMIGAAFGFALILGGVVFIAQGNLIGGIWWLLIGFFLRNAAISSYEQLVIRDMLQGEPISRFMNPDPVVVSPQLSVADFVEKYLYVYHYKIFPVVDHGKLLGSISTADVKGIPKENWSGTTVGQLARPVSDSNTVEPDVNSLELLPHMLKQGEASTFLVVSGDHLVGIVALKDLWEYISIRLQLEPPDRKS